MDQNEYEALNCLFYRKTLYFRLLERYGFDSVFQPLDAITRFLYVSLVVYGVFEYLARIVQFAIQFAYDLVVLKPDQISSTVAQ
jgi:hypothetical protein